jgi:hypothetical protein
MTRYSKKNGKYHISGSNYEMLMGTRAQVWHGTAYKTSGGLKKSDLFQNKAGRIVSKTKHSSAKRENRLVKSGYGTKKGQFGFVKLSSTSKRGRKGKSRKMRGGSPYGNPFSPASFSGNGIDGQGITDYGSSSIDVQLAAGQAGGRKRRMRGGSPYGSLVNPASISDNVSGYGSGSGSGIDGQGITNYGSSSIDVQLAAGQAGGRKRKMRGGTDSRMRGMMPGSTGVQMQAGLGN